MIRWCEKGKESTRRKNMWGFPVTSWEACKLETKQTIKKKNKPNNCFFSRSQVKNEKKGGKETGLLRRSKSDGGDAGEIAFGRLEDIQFQGKT